MSKFDEMYEYATKRIQKYTFALMFVEVKNMTYKYLVLLALIYKYEKEVQYI